MAELRINGSVVDAEGANYPVRFEWVPRVGDLVDLYSFSETASGHQSTHHFEVAQIVHRVYDVTQADPDGRHLVTVFVKRSESAYFGA
jgi:hypothetical protein